MRDTPLSRAAEVRLASPLSDEAGPHAELGQSRTDSGTRDNAGVKNMHQLIQLRWIAVIGQVATIVFVHFGFNIKLPLMPMAIVLACLAAFNLVSMLRWRRREEVTNGALFLALLVDILTLTAQLYLSGGAANPFVFLYLLQVVLAAVLLRTWASWAVVVVTSLCFIALTAFAGPVVIPADPTRGLADPYVQGMLLCFVLNATLLVVFITRIGRILRARDARLADLRQRAAEEEHIVRMGLLASGAAHELGTPLATLSVILGDWRRMPPFTQQPELLQELDEMQTQLTRCKSIVTGILLSAGEARGEAPAQTTVVAFLDDLVAQWRGTRPVRGFDYENGFGEDVAIISDSGLKQMICNVLDNALEASPGWVGLESWRDGDKLVLRVSDAGPGFAPAMLSHFGKPYQSSKGRPGGGLGLFLALNVARQLGGSIVARNREPSGAVVTMSLPLSPLTLSEAGDE
ncbi:MULTISPECIES: ATP-binding protein [Lysobacter]|uniref:histidine kinase n=1 Tax=Lysobacter gummosus TaxID=262324 RepID=A0ABY3XJG8_9GAMM|nr:MULTISPECIES: ATP-binding protein [Lysobacter]ALN91397.1 histidine kinase-, DNA gyrase B-, and HSP90-like ATPase family protein [Lysobacter gummosus]UJB21550.1 ATP-binding protein [Lysobacter capsici]UJQ29333.1 ATP-binding protein [Lysobacter gummosus]UNP31775.1 ATP-binding protein [Lysobacter gummosus]